MRSRNDSSIQEILQRQTEEIDQIRLKADVWRSALKASDGKRKENVA